MLAHYSVVQVSNSDLHNFIMWFMVCIGQQSLDVNAQNVVPQIDKPQHTCTGTFIGTFIQSQQTEEDSHRITTANNATESSMPKTEAGLASKQGIHSQLRTHYMVRKLGRRKV